VRFGGVETFLREVLIHSQALNESLPIISALAGRMMIVLQYEQEACMYTPMPATVVTAAATAARMTHIACNRCVWLCSYARCQDHCSILYHGCHTDTASTCNCSSARRCRRVCATVREQYAGVTRVVRIIASIDCIDNAWSIYNATSSVTMWWIESIPCRHHATSNNNNNFETARASCESGCE
jgi:hypothetical protein